MLTRAEEGALRDRARKLYSWGYNTGRIAALVGRSPSTVSAWQRRDARAGLDWEALRDATRRTNRRVLIATLERRLQEAADDDVLAPAARADAIFKLSLALEAERELGRRVPRLVSYPVAARLLGCSMATVRRYVKDGKVMGVATSRRHRNGRRVWAISMASILGFHKGDDDGAAGD